MCVCLWMWSIAGICMLILVSNKKIGMAKTIIVFVSYFICVFFCGLKSVLNIKGHIATVPVCSSGTLTNVLLYWNAMPQTQNMTPRFVTVCRHRADLSLCYPLIWNITLEYTTTQFYVLGQTQSGNPSPTFQTHKQKLNSMVLLRW